MTTVAAPVAAVAEIARRAERAHADTRLFTHYAGDDGTSLDRKLAFSAASRRDAHIADLSILTGRSYPDLRVDLDAGRLVAAVAGEQPTALVSTCVVCGATRETILARYPKLGREVSGRFSGMPRPVCRKACRTCM